MKMGISVMNANASHLILLYLFTGLAAIGAGSVLWKMEQGELRGAIETSVLAHFLV